MSSSEDFDESLDQEVNKWIVYEKLHEKFGSLVFSVADALANRLCTDQDLLMLRDEGLLVSEGDRHWLRHGEGFDDLERELREDIG